MRVRAIVLSIASMGLLLLGPALATTHAAASTPATATSTTTDSCTAMPRLSADRLDPVTGRRASVAATRSGVVRAVAGDATEASFRGPGGLIQSTVVPPTDWSPLTSSQPDLQRYGFPIRPAVGTPEEASWLTQFRAYSPQTQIDPMCSMPAFNDTAGSVIWSGVGSYNGCCGASSFVAIQGAHYVPTFDATCSTTQADAESSWVGLGGVGAGLLQAGVENPRFSNGGSVAFYEYLTPTNFNGAVPIPQVPVAAGNLVYSAVSYAGGTGYFRVTNATTGKTWPVTVGGLQGYYNGATANFIDERPSTGSPGNLWATKLRRPSQGYVQWADAYVWTATSGQTAIPVGLSIFRYFKMTQSPNGQGALLMSVDGGLANHTTWRDVWHSCGVEVKTG